MKKIFFKIVASILTVTSISSPLVRAHKTEMPKGTYRVFTIAVIGSDIVDGKPIEQNPGFNQYVMDSLCSVCTKLENFNGFEVINDNEISLGDQRLPRASASIKNNIFCFYDITKYGPDLIRECSHAICPYKLDTAETLDNWKERMTRLRDFVKTRNEMCDLRFLGIIDGYTNKTYPEEISDYILHIHDLASHVLDIYKYQQTVNAEEIFSDESSVYSDCEFIIETVFLSWDREHLFKEYTGKDFLRIIKNDGMQPAILYSCQTPLALVYPKKIRTPVDVKAIACNIYNGFFLPDGDVKLSQGFTTFKKFLEILHLEGFSDSKIIDGLSNILLKNFCLSAQVQLNKFFDSVYKIRGRHVRDDIILSLYKKIFNDEKVCQSFEKVFVECLSEGITYDQVLAALRGMNFGEGIYGHVYYYHNITTPNMCDIVID